MKILITGAAGFIGSHLVKEFQKENYVYALIKKGQKMIDHKNCKIIELDLNTFTSFDLLPKNLDLIIHLSQANVAFPKKASQMFTVNTVSTQKLLDYGRVSGIGQFIFASSGSVYGSSELPFHENSPVTCSDFYSFTKYSSELLIHQYKSFFSTVILRLFTPYGPGQKNRLIPQLISRIQLDQKVKIFNQGNPRLNPLFISDIISIFKRLMYLKGNKIFNAGGEEIYSLKEIADIIGQIYSKKVRFQYLSDSNKKDLTGDISRMKQLLKYSPQIDLPAGILKMRNL